METEAYEDLEKQGGPLRAVKDLTAGAAGGIAQVLIGMSTISWVDLRLSSIRIRILDINQC